MGKFKESRTAQNLLTSFAFESQASARYHFFSDKAQKDGFVQIAYIFEETAIQEREHALRFFKFFNGGELEITASFRTGVIQSTHENLLSSADLENHVHTELYPGFASVAREENYQRAAETWDAIIVAEQQHERTFSALESHPGFDIARRQMQAFGGMLSFELDTQRVNTHQFLRGLKMIRPAFSLGGVESVICSPAVTSHAKISDTERAQLGITEGLLRLSVGIEDPDDILADIEQAFRK